MPLHCPKIKIKEKENQKKILVSKYTIMHLEFTIQKSKL